MARKKDILEQKKSELNTYVQMFNSAVSVVTNTVSNLNSINEGISERIKEIEAYQAELNATMSGLVEAKDQNERVIKNFNALINFEI